MDLLRRLPQNVRRTIYTFLTLVGAALALCGYLGVDNIGSLSLDAAFKSYATLSPLIGGVALANVGASGKTAEVAAFGAFDEDVDLASFEPVGDASEVFSESLS
jgi:ABC-type transporter Mla maintaining outer membrane lipid asymmetry permease subunit MlaE